MAVDHSEGVTERRALLSVRGCYGHMPLLDRLGASHEQGYDGEQPKQARRGMGDGLVRSLTLGLDA